MKKSRKIWALMLCVAIVVSCFTGCGKSAIGSKEKNKINPNAINVQLGVWNSGLGVEWLDKMIEAFEDKHPEYNIMYKDSGSVETVIASLGMEDVDTTDLYLCFVTYNTEHLEPLDDILSSKADGESLTIGEKFIPSYLKNAQAADGHYYTLNNGGGVIGFVYNKKIFNDAGVKQIPRTTDELTAVCDVLYSKGYTPLCHFTGGGYYAYLDHAFMAQYDGLEYMVDNFYGCKDEAGHTPSADVFTKQDGRYEMLKAYEKFLTPEYTLTGSNTKSHTEVQTEFLYGKAAMMLNGSWVENEMKGIGNMDDFDMMKLPILSSIIHKLTTVKGEKLLREVVTAIDQVTSGEKQLSDFASGEDYIVDGKTVSAADWEYIKKARNTVSTNYCGDVAYIPKYANADEKEGAKEFLKFMYSDEGIKIYVETTNNPLPIKLSTGETIDVSGASQLTQSIHEMVNTAEVLADSHLNNRHSIFINGGASYLAGVPFVYRFTSSNPKDRMTSEEVWTLITDTINDKYEGTWLKNIERGK